MDLLWFVIPLAIVIFVVRTLMIAWSLKGAAANPTVANARALREAKRSLKEHHARLDEAVAQAKGHLAAAKRMAAVSTTRASVAVQGDLEVAHESVAEPQA